MWRSRALLRQWWHNFKKIGIFINQGRLYILYYFAHYENRLKITIKNRIGLQLSFIKCHQNYREYLKRILTYTLLYITSFIRTPTKSSMKAYFEPAVSRLIATKKQLGKSCACALETPDFIDPNWRKTRAVL